MNKGKDCPREANCAKLYCRQSANEFVSSQEELIRILFHPDHFDTNGEVSISAIAEKDILSEGVSVDRKSMLTADKYKKIISKIRLRPGETISSAAITSAEKVRQAENCSAYICPSGSKGHRSHSSIYSKTDQLDEKSLYYLRDALRDAFSQAIGLDEIYRNL